MTDIDKAIKKIELQIEHESQYLGKMRNNSNFHFLDEHRNIRRGLDFALTILKNIKDEDDE